jgi:L-iditol 2-dehydrogenase
MAKTKAQTMRSVLFYGPIDIRLERRPVPAPGPGEALLEVKAALTCGTDFKAYRQGHPVLLARTPSPFGHEMAGVIAAVGGGVTALGPGDRVVAANSAPCDECFFCRRGETELCDHLDLLNGCYAEYILLPARIVRHNVHKIPDSLDYSVAAMAEPLACAIHAVDRLVVRPGETIVVIGAGNMARYLIVALKDTGVRIIVLGRNAERLRLAREAGAHEIMDVSRESDLPAAVRRLTLEGRGPDAVIEAVGKPETWKAAVEMARKGGRVCFFGGCKAGSSAEIDTHRLHYQELRLFGVFHHRPEHVKHAVALLSQGHVPKEIFIQGRISLEEVVPFFQTHAEGSPLKAEVLP